MILSCTQVSLSASFPSAARQASFALVPVPHGERSKAAPGQRTKFLAFALGVTGGPISSMWSTSGYPCSLIALRILHPIPVSSLTLAVETLFENASVRKNQLPPHATSPVIFP